MRAARRLFAILPIVLGITSSVAAQAAGEQKPPTIAAKTAQSRKLAGLLPLYWDAGSGKLWLEIDALDRELLFIDSLPAGVGSNDIGLDRGQYGDPRIVSFTRRGPRVLLVQPNQDFRAVTS